MENILKKQKTDASSSSNHSNNSSSMMDIVSDSPASPSASTSSSALQDIMEFSRCALCNFYLSVAPISIISDEGAQKCGRCKGIKTDISQRNIPFENIIKDITFSCQFEKCKAQLTWGNVEAHEKVCTHKVINCPVNWECSMTIPITELLSHFKVKHERNLCYENYIDENFKFGYHTSVLLIKDEIPFLIWSRSDPEESNFEVSAFCFSTNLKYKYEMTLTKRNSKKVSLLFQGDVIHFEERIHCIKCSMGDCEEKHHNYSRPSTTTKIDFCGVQKTLKSDIYYCLITIKKNKYHLRDDSAKICLTQISFLAAMKN